jgi:PKD repeat protein
MYYWTFGDGSEVFAKSSAVHDYGKNGTYTIELIAYNPSGYTTATHTIQMNAQEGDAEINTSEERVLILNENTSYTFNITSNITLDHTEFWVNGDLFQVEGNELVYNFTEGGVYYNVTAYGVSASGNYSAPITWRVTVHRGLATTHMEKFDETNYNYLMDNITHFNTTNIAEVSTLPFTNLMGRAFYLILFVMPFALLWMKQRMLTIPVVMALITGCIFIGFIPAQYMGFLTYAVILSFAVALYLLGRERF